MFIPFNPTVALATAALQGLPRTASAAQRGAQLWRGLGAAALRTG